MLRVRDKCYTFSYILFQSHFILKILYFPSRLQLRRWRTKISYDLLKMTISLKHFLVRNFLKRCKVPNIQRFSSNSLISDIIFKGVLQLRRRWLDASHLRGNHQQHAGTVRSFFGGGESLHSTDEHRKQGGKSSELRVQG